MSFQAARSRASQSALEHRSAIILFCTNIQVWSKPVNQICTHDSLSIYLHPRFFVTPEVSSNASRCLRRQMATCTSRLHLDKTMWLSQIRSPNHVATIADRERARTSPVGSICKYWITAHAMIFSVEQLRLILNRTSITGFR